MYEEIKKIIEDASEYVDFGDFGNGVSEEWIKLAEERLGIELPESYKWWLKNYGGGEINGEEIYSIYEEDFDTVVGGDIVYMYELNKENADFPKCALVICETDDEVFYFDVSKKSFTGEYPVYELYSNKKYAENFIEFLKKRIVE